MYKHQGYPATFVSSNVMNNGFLRIVLAQNGAVSSIPCGRDSYCRGSTAKSFRMAGLTSVGHLLLRSMGHKTGLTMASGQRLTQIDQTRHVDILRLHPDGYGKPLLAHDTHTLFGRC